MAAPNLNSSSLTVTAAVDRAAPANTAEASLTANAGGSGHTYITLSLMCANNTASAVAVTVNWYDGSNNNRISVSTSVAGNSSFEAAPTRKLLLEGWTIKITTGTANAIEFQHHYLDCH